jgi:hypothetical protein
MDGVLGGLLAAVSIGVLGLLALSFVFGIVIAVL